MAHFKTVIWKQELNLLQLYQFKKKKSPLISEVFMLSIFEIFLGIFTWLVLLQSC